MGEYVRKVVYSCIDRFVQKIKIMDNLNGSNSKEEKELTEVEEWELERKLMRLAFENSYKVLTNKLTFKELMTGNHVLGKSAVLAHDPQEGITLREYDAIMDYFEEGEEYEKCAELMTCLDGDRE